MSFLQIPHIFAHADEQVYARILHLIWKHGESYSTIIPLSGAFHHLRVIQKIIFKRHGVIGHKDWFVDFLIFIYAFLSRDNNNPRRVN